MDRLVNGPMTAPSREQMRARYPDESGYVQRDGVRVYYEAYGTGEPAILFLPTWEIVHSRAWKFQIPYFARHGRVVTFDRRGNGRSDRPVDVRACDRRVAVGDALAVLDRVGAGRVVVVSWCAAGDDLILAVEHPERVAGLVLIGPDLLLTADPAEEEGPYPFDEELKTQEGWAKWNRHYFLRDWPGFVEFFFTQTFTEPHSTKQIEDAIGWGLQTDPQAILRGIDAEWTNDRDSVLRLSTQVPCPTLVIQGSQDAVVGPARGAAVADAIPHAQLITLEGCGHAPHLRDPVMTNLLIRDFALRTVGTIHSSSRKRRISASMSLALDRKVLAAQQLNVNRLGAAAVPSARALGRVTTLPIPCRSGSARTGRWRLPPLPSWIPLADSYCRGGCDSLGSNRRFVSGWRAGLARPAPQLFWIADDSPGPACQAGPGASHSGQAWMRRIWPCPAPKPNPWLET
jgi:pimeloyl-ACP methyl ester carboxylesterase